MQRWYLINTPASREALERLRREEIDPSEAVGADVGPIEVVRIYRPNIFTLYERNIGVLTPLIADRLRDAELSLSARVDKRCDASGGGAEQAQLGVRERNTQAVGDRGEVKWNRSATS